MHIRPVAGRFENIRLNAKGLRHLEIRIHLESPRRSAILSGALSRSWSGLLKSLVERLLLC